MSDSKGLTPWAQKYQQMIDAGLLEFVPVANPGRFTYPSSLVSVPSITTNRTPDEPIDQGKIRAKLE